MRKAEYAIVDIETTGGHAGGSRITEIAILIHDGTRVIDRWESLVNPQKDIPPAIFALTGIDNAMVRDAPIFESISEKVLELLSDRVFVAHNVNFDYSFVRHELKESGFNWTARKLCTVRAARKILPGHASYSLGKLCHSLRINLENRHRAGGDADATAVLFGLLLEADREGHMQNMIKKTAQDQRLPPNLPPQDFERLPETPGIYYFYDQERNVIYVGKAINIKKRVASHFSGNSVTQQRQNFLKDIHAISFETCGTELMALLLECSEIRKLWPKYNRALKRHEAKFGLYRYEARNGYQYLAIGKLGKFQNCLQTFSNEYEGTNALRGLAEKFNIDYRFCKYGLPAEGIFSAANADLALPDPEQHNEQVENAIQFLLEERPNFHIIDKGRHPQERSCIWVEEGAFFGMGYFDTAIGFSGPLELREQLIRYKSNHYIMQLIRAYAEKNPRKVVHHKKASPQ